MTFNSKEIAENLHKQGGFIEGVRGGEQTEKYLSEIINRLTLFGAFSIGYSGTYADHCPSFYKHQYYDWWHKYINPCICCTSDSESSRIKSPNGNVRSISATRLLL